MIIDKIIEATALVFGVKELAIFSRSRKRNVAEARQMAMSLCYDHTSYDLVEIGQLFERRHSTVIYAIRKTEWQKEHDRQTREYYKKIMDLIKTK